MIGFRNAAGAVSYSPAGTRAWRSLCELPAVGLCLIGCESMLEHLVYLSILDENLDHTMGLQYTTTRIGARGTPLIVGESLKHAMKLRN